MLLILCDKLCLSFMQFHYQMLLDVCLYLEKCLRFLYPFLPMGVKVARYFQGILGLFYNPVYKILQPFSRLVNFIHNIVQPSLLIFICVLHSSYLP
jgi:hypothetical protein